MTRAEEIYYAAVKSSRLEHERMVRLFTSGRIDICPCGMDMEKAAIIQAFDEALAGVTGRRQ